MRTAITADIHGNLSAFQAVLEDLSTQEIDHLVNLGDFIGYGPEPEAVAQILRNRRIPSVLGNHEIALIDDAILNSFTTDAYNSILITRRLVTVETIAQIKTLPVFISEGDCRFVHGVPPDSIYDYITYCRQYELQNAFKFTPEWLTFVGHTHMLGIYEYNDSEITISVLKKGRRQLKRSQKYIINVGSVGQPRDRNNLSKYVIFDDKTDELTVRWVAYDVERTIDLIIAAGLPEQNAWRLR